MTRDGISMICPFHSEDENVQHSNIRTMRSYRLRGNTTDEKLKGAP